MIGHYPLNHFPARCAWEDLAGVAGITHIPAWASYIISTLFVTSTICTSLVVRAQPTLARACVCLGPLWDVHVWCLAWT